VTGATNLTEGAIVPYADEGAAIIDGHTGERTILRGKPMRGIKSEGMVLSQKELGLSDEHEGIHILDANLPVGALLREVLGETVLALELQPNRPDCLGVVGIAREVAALLGTGLREPPVDRLSPAAAKGLDVRIEDDRACPRFAAALLSGIKTGPSPAWMQARLVAAGMRPIDNVVDITNYVMLELGQPLHVYDHRKLRGGALVARQARRGESLRTLDGVDRVLPEGTLVIADAERALGVAGILGGEDSEIREDTTTVALECASFEPRGIGRTATKLGLHGSSGSAAARRFSWELSSDLVPIALARACRLLREHAGAKIESVVDRYPNPRARVNVRMRFSDVPRVMGIDIDPAETLDILRRLQFTAGADGDTLVATPPAVRTDIAIAEDIVEEVGRIAGYDRLPTRIPDGPARGAASPRRVPRTGARRSGRIRSPGDRLVLAHRSRVAEAAHRRRLVYRAGASARGEPDHGVAVRGAADPAREPARDGTKEPAAPFVRRDLRDRSYISAEASRPP